jgi:hypothetical protein
MERNMPLGTFPHPGSEHAPLPTNGTSGAGQDLSPTRIQNRNP